MVSQGCRNALEVWGHGGYGAGNCTPVIPRGWMVQCVLVNGMGLGSLIGDLGCTALMKANSRNIHLDVCSLPRLMCTLHRHVGEV